MPTDTKDKAIDNIELKTNGLILWCKIKGEQVALAAINIPDGTEYTFADFCGILDIQVAQIKEATKAACDGAAITTYDRGTST